jgi:hypothetical protein
LIGVTKDAQSVPEFSITGADGEEQHGTNGRIVLTIYPDTPGTKLRKRNAIKHACTPWVHREQWLYAELDGVRCYVKDEGARVHIVVTKQDLYP